jgi:hypothetical protein
MALISTSRRSFLASLAALRAGILSGAFKIPTSTAAAVAPNLIKKPFRPYPYPVIIPRYMIEHMKPLDIWDDRFHTVRRDK